MVTELGKIKMMFWHFVLHASLLTDNLGNLLKEHVAYVITSEYSDSKSIVTCGYNNKAPYPVMLVSKEWVRPVNLIINKLPIAFFNQHLNVNLVEAIDTGLQQARKDCLDDFDIHIQIS